MDKFHMVQYFKYLYKQYSKYNLIIKQNIGRFMLNISTCHCCSNLWTRTIKQTNDFKQRKVYTSSRDGSDATPLDAKFTNFTVYIVITYLYSDIYAKGYIVFVIPFIRLCVGMFVCSFLTMTTFLFKVFPVVCISETLMRKHFYLKHSYPGGWAFTSWLQSLGFLPLDGAGGQIIGHL